MTFSLPSFPLKSLTQSSPIAAGMKTGLMGQKLQQQSLESAFLPQQLRAALMQQQQKALQERERTPFVPFQEMTGGLGKLTGLASTVTNHPYLATAFGAMKKLDPSLYEKVSKYFHGALAMPGSQTPSDSPGVTDNDLEPVPGMPGVYFHKNEPNKFFRLNSKGK
jgi:hypothetical protein